MYWKARREIIFRHTGEHPFEISGPDALKFLQKIFPRDISKVKIGRCSYQFACYHDGGMITDGILLRIDQNKYWFAQAEGDMFSWYKAQAEGLNVKIDEPNVWVSQVQGPRSMELLDLLTKTNISSNWKYFDWKEVNISGEKTIISRSGFSNELGWEIYLPTEFAQDIFDKIIAAGGEHGLKLAGMHALNSLRLEKAYRHWGHDITDEDTPLDAGLSFAVKFDKKGGFIGRDALLKQKESKVLKRRLVQFALDDPQPLLYHNEPIWCGDIIVGDLTSGMYGHTIGTCLGMGYVSCEEGVSKEFLESNRFEIEVAGERYPARPSLRAFYDPKSERVRM